MGEGIFNKFKNWITEEEEDFDGVEEEYEQEDEEEVEQFTSIPNTKTAKIVNLHLGIRKSIFEFMNGAVYVLDGGIQKVSKGIFILAPNNVDIDSSIKKELESKTLFPWQSK